MKRILWALLVVGCGQKTTAPPAESANPPPASAPVPSPSVVTPTTPATPKSNVVLTIRGPGELEVEPNGTALAVEAKVEMQQNGAWETLTPSEPYRLLENCSLRDLPQCTASDRTMSIASWSGMTCGTQCAASCRGTVPYGRGPFRFTVSSCDGKTSMQSPVFELDERHWAAQSTTKGFVARVDQPPKWDGTEAPSATTIGGMKTKGDKQALDDDTRKALVAALDDPKGFDDQIQKRCAMGTKIGFQLTRTLPTTGAQSKEQTNDIVIDLTCQKLFISRGDKAPRHVHATHFDPSRPAFVAIAKKYFPDVK